MRMRIVEPLVALSLLTIPALSTAQTSIGASARSTTYDQALRGELTLGLPDAVAEPNARVPDPGSVIPEPATIALVGTGLLAVAVLRRRRRS